MVSFLRRRWLWIAVSAALVGVAFLPAVFRPATTPESASPTAQEPEAPPEIPDVKWPLIDDAVANRLRSALARECAAIPKGCKASIEVRDPSNGQILFERDARTALIPASNAKVFTAAAMLDLYGPEHEIETPFLALGPLVDGVLHGDLVVRGAGDVTLSSRLAGEQPMRLMHALARQLKQVGIMEVRGRILADGTAFTGPRRGPNWPKDASWRRSMVEVSALVFNENRARLECWVDGGRPYASLLPDVGVARLTNRLQVAADPKSEVINVARPEDRDEFTVSGKIASRKARYSTDVNVHEGDLYFVAALNRALRDNGVETRGFGAFDGSAEALDREPIFVYKSRVIDSLPTMLQVSQNLYAEVYFRLVGLARGGGGSFAGGARGMRLWFEDAGLFEPGTVLVDGSGLSRDNRCSARQLTRVHEHCWKRRDLRDIYRTSLASPGEEGTLSRRVPALGDVLFAKTGTLNGVTSLSGFVQNDSGRWLVFAMLFNGDVSGARRVQDRLVTALRSHDLGSPSANLAQAGTSPDLER